ncbi:unnamed protein product [marine sediment metagenome]|uniref:Methyltransferase type 11 domain-containing protein n=1 Tax=marine sediment metagenome TaxID=412755 RepID=X0TR45_9ZZZZ
MNHLRRLFYRWIIKKYLKDCDSVLDLGAGTGIFYDVAAEEGKEVSGCDLDKRNIRDNIKLMSYQDVEGDYDAVWNCNLIEHVNQFEFMEVCKNHCKKVLITVTGRPRKSFWDTPDHIRPYTKKCVERLYKAYGFKTVFSKNIYPTWAFVVVGVKENKE